jgi:hypothetical protein
MRHEDEGKKEMRFVRTADYTFVNLENVTVAEVKDSKKGSEDVIRFHLVDGTFVDSIPFHEKHGAPASLDKIMSRCGFEEL